MRVQHSESEAEADREEVVSGQTALVPVGVVEADRLAVPHALDTTTDAEAAAGGFIAGAPPFLSV